MDIATSCSTIRQCNECFVMRKASTVDATGAASAVQVLKQFLERARADGRPIRELDIAEHLLWTEEGMRWVMPFVFSAEAMLAHERRKRNG